jgi:hypothetical protein
VYLALYARRAWVIFDHPYNADSARLPSSAAGAFCVRRFSCSAWLSRRRVSPESSGQWPAGGVRRRQVDLHDQAPGPGRARTVPACAAVIERTMDRPRPALPPWSVRSAVSRRNGSNSTDTCSAGTH